MHIKIYDKHQPTEHEDNEELYMNYLVLGVHSFANFLHELTNKRNIKVLIVGKIETVLQNVLWNQFFSYTLLRDVDRVVFQGAEHRNTFLKAGTRTYRLAECLDWAGFKKIEREIGRCNNLCIQGFMADSSIKFLTIQIAERPGPGYDLVFEYLPNEAFNSFASNQDSRVEVYSTQPKPKPKDHMRSTIAVKSLFQGNEPRPRNDLSIKYSTETKTRQSRGKPQKNPIIVKKEPIKKAKRSPSFKNSQKQKQNSVFSLKTSSNYVTGTTQPLFCAEQNRKEQITSNILHKKEEKIREYRAMLEQKQKQYQEKIGTMEAKHEEEVSAIKKEVQEVLSTYKKKNKTLRKENECLIDMNKKLTAVNTKLEQTIASMAQDMSGLKSKQQALQKSSIESTLKLSTLQNANQILLDRMNRQESQLKSQINEKDRTTVEIRTKYERLLGSIKSATADIESNRD